MNSKSVHLIATDPPFNKGKDFHATPDSLSKDASFHDRWSWEKDVHESWVDQITDDWPLVMNVIQGSRNSYGDDMGAFLCYMAVRLIAMRRVLRDDGSIYLHCDPTASHYLKELMDAIFGKQNFRNEIVWCYGQSARGGKATARQFARNSDVILFYSKENKKHIWNKPYFECNKYPINELPTWIKRDEAGRYFRTAPRGNYTDKSIEKLRAEGRIYDTARGNIRIKYFMDVDDTGNNVLEPILCGNVWNIPDMMHTSKKERTGFPTQKPLALYERIIQTSSNEGDMVLDPFAGCATTCIAAERLKRQWVGIDIWERAHEVVVKRLRNEGMFAVPESDKKDLWRMFGELRCLEEAPERTDDGDTAAPFLRTTERPHEPPGPRWTHAKMRAHLLEQKGCKCQGCGRSFDDDRYLELDHIIPRADGGINHVSNRILLCGPCNRAKSHRLTLSGLQELNRKNGWMADGTT